MPQKAKGPRLYLQPARYGKTGKLIENPVWVIRDRSFKRSTGFGENQRAEAEVALRGYLEKRPQETTFYVYFLTAKCDGFPIKIGISKNHLERVPALQNALPYDVDILCVVPTTDPTLERRLHSAFASTRLRGEWFERSDDLMNTIQAFAEAETA